MENMLKKLFDYQKFEKNENLERIIRDSKDKYSTKLSDDTLYYVNAAGNIKEANLLEKEKNNPNGIKHKLTSLSEGTLLK